MHTEGLGPPCCCFESYVVLLYHNNKPRKTLTESTVSFRSTLFFFLRCLFGEDSPTIQDDVLQARDGHFSPKHQTVKQAFGNSRGIVCDHLSVSGLAMETQAVPTSDKPQAHQSSFCISTRDPLYCFPTTLLQTHAHAQQARLTRGPVAPLTLSATAASARLLTRDSHTRVPVILARGTLHSGSLHRWSQLEGELLQVRARCNSCKSVAKEVSPRGRRSDSPVPAGLGSAPFPRYHHARLSLPSLCTASEKSCVIVHCTPADARARARALAASSRASP